MAYYFWEPREQAGLKPQEFHTLWVATLQMLFILLLLPVTLLLNSALWTLEESRLKLCTTATHRETP